MKYSQFLFLFPVALLAAPFPSYADGSKELALANSGPASIAEDETGEGALAVVKAETLKKESVAVSATPSRRPDHQVHYGRGETL